MSGADEGYRFISVEAGSYGSSSDSDVSKNSAYGILLENNKTNIPDARLMQTNYTCHLCLWVTGDEVFALSEHVLRPYSKKHLTCFRRIYITTGCHEHRG